MSFRRTSALRSALRAAHPHRSWTPPSRLSALSVLALFLTLAGRAHAGFPPERYIEATGALLGGRFDAARATLLELVQENPDEGRYADRYARACLLQKTPKSGIAELEAVTRNAPGTTGHLAALAELYERAGDKAGARAVLARGARLGARHAPLWRAFVRNALLDSSLSSATELLDSLETRSNDSPAPAYARGIRALLTGDRDRATAELEEAIRRDPDYLSAYSALAEVQGLNQSTTQGFATWREGLSRAVGQGDLVAQLEFLESMGDAGINAGDPAGIEPYVEALPIAERLGERDRAARIRTGLFNLERIARHVGRARYWGEVEALRLRELGDTLNAAQRLAFLGGSLGEENDGWAGVEFLERALLWSEHLTRSAFRVSASARVARYRLVLGDLDGALEAGTRAESIGRDYLKTLPVARIERLRIWNVRAHVALIRGERAEAESIYRAVARSDVGGEGVVPRAEASILLARCLRERGATDSALVELSGARAFLAGRRDSLLQDLAAWEQLAAFEAQGSREALAALAGEILGRSGRVALRGLRSEAALALAHIHWDSRHQEAIGYLVRAWIEAESESGRRRLPEIPARLLPDPEAPLERLALYFARLAFEPGTRPTWEWQRRAPSGHEPRSDDGLLALRWSFFFSSRHHSRILEQILALAPDGPLPSNGIPQRRYQWNEVRAAAENAALALEAGHSPEGGPGLREALAPLAAERARAFLGGHAEYGRVAWLLTPPETMDLQAALRTEGGTLLAYHATRAATLVYLIQGERLRLYVAEMCADSLASAVRAVVPYFTLGCRTPDLESLPPDFEPAAHLWNVLLGPAGESLDLSRNLWIVPDGPLWYLPFELLAPRGGELPPQDGEILLEGAARIPLALDRHRIGYLPDAGLMLPKRKPDEHSEKSLSGVLFLVGDRTSERPDAVHGCGPDASTRASLLREAGGLAAEEVRGECDLGEARSAGLLCLFAPSRSPLGEGGTGGLILGGARTRDCDGILRWIEFADLPEAPILLLPSAPFEGIAIASPAFHASNWGVEIVAPALGAALSGREVLIHSLWNASEATWITFASILRHERPSLENFHQARVDLRGVKLRAGPNHQIALAHPYFSSATRWWQLVFPTLKVR